LQGGISGKIRFSPLETKRTTLLSKNLMGNVKFQNPGAALAPLPTPMTLKLLMTKRLRKITKIYLLISI